MERADGGCGPVLRWLFCESGGDGDVDGDGAGGAFAEPALGGGEDAAEAALVFRGHFGQGEGDLVGSVAFLPWLGRVRADEVIGAEELWVFGEGSAGFGGSGREDDGVWLAAAGGELPVVGGDRVLLTSLAEGIGVRAGGWFLLSGGDGKGEVGVAWGARSGAAHP